MSALFVTGTGTDIGKTFVAAGLIRELRRRGRAVDALKPVVSGFEDSARAASDPGILLEALGLEATSAAVARIAPWRFRAPLSPDLAARQERRSLDFAALLAFSRAAIAACRGTLLIEGVGGIMVPLDASRTVLDWMTALGLPVLVVAGSYLGTISHSLSALEVLRRRRLEITALVVSESAGSTVPLSDTVATIARFAGPVPVLGLARTGGSAAGDPAFAALADLV